MDTSKNPHDPTLDRFDEWLKESSIQPPVGMLARVRTRLQEPAPELDDVIDQLLQQDPRLSDPQMIRKVRRGLAQWGDVPQRTGVWFKWLTPLAAAATLTIAFISFQSRAPQRVDQIAEVTRIAPAPASALEDQELTQIFALAANLQSNTDMTKLESMENLAFLFD